MARENITIKKSGKYFVITTFMLSPLNKFWETFKNSGINAITATTRTQNNA